MSDPGDHVRRTHTFIQAAFVLAFAYGFLEILQRLQPLMIALGAAFVLAYLLDPLVLGLQRRKVPRVASVILVLGACGSLLALILSLTMPLVSSQVAEFVDDAPKRMGAFSDWIELSSGTTVTLLWDELQSEISARMSSGEIRDLVGSLSGGIESLSRVLVVIALIPIFTLYLLLDFPRLIRFLGSLVPPRNRARVYAIAREISDVIAQWVRGELVVMVTLSGLYSFGLVYVGAPLGVLVGFIMGMLAFIPYIGPGLGLSLGIVLTLMDFQGWGQILGLLGVFAIVQTLDGLFITPRILGGSVGLNPAAVIAGLMVCGSLFGIGGVMIAVPLTASVVVIVRHLVRRYRESEFFLEGSDAEGVVVDADPSLSRSHMG